MNIGSSLSFLRRGLGRGTFQFNEGEKRLPSSQPSPKGRKSIAILIHPNPPLKKEGVPLFHKEGLGEILYSECK